MVLDKLFGRSAEMPTAESALPGRDHYIFDIPKHHAVNGNRIQPPFPEGMEAATFALGCFWGAERLYWKMDGVWSTFAGYSGGFTPHPTYQEVCTGNTGHAEVVEVIFDPRKVTYAQLVKVFFENHDPTQGMRQGGDVGTQYRSAIYYHNDEQKAIAEEMAASFNRLLKNAGYNEMTTEIVPAKEFYYAEEYHQQYLHKVPDGYCGLKGTGITCAVSRQDTVNLTEELELPTTGDNS